MQWRTAGVCPQAFWLHYLSGIGSPLATEAAWRAAGNLSRFLLAVLIGESQAGTHFNRNRPENRNALNLRPPLRPDGTREPGDYMRFDRWEDGIRAARERITSPTYGKGIYARTTTVLEFAHVWAPRTDDNNPEAFAAAIEERISSYPKETTTMPNPQPPLEIALTPAGRPNRPGLIMPSPSYITVHEVGNLSPGANEDMHRNFVHNGGGAHNVSFHFVVGPTKAIQLFELDQVTWHASDGFNGTGNRDSVAIETIQIGDFDRTLWHLSWLIAEIIKNPRRFATTAARAWDFSPARIVQHNHWAPDNKNCPQFIRDRGLWPVLMGRVNAWLRAEGAPTYAKPSIPAFLKDEAQLATGDDRKIGKTPVIAFRRLWTAKKETGRFQHGGAKAPEIGPKIKKGESFLGEFVYRSTGEWWVLTRWGSRIRMRDLDYPPFFADELKAA